MAHKQLTCYGIKVYGCIFYYLSLELHEIILIDITYNNFLGLGGEFICEVPRTGRMYNLNNTFPNYG